MPGGYTCSSQGLDNDAIVSAVLPWGFLPTTRCLVPSASTSDYGLETYPIILIAVSPKQNSFWDQQRSDRLFRPVRASEQPGRDRALESGASHDVLIKAKFVVNVKQGRARCRSCRENAHKFSDAGIEPTQPTMFSRTHVWCVTAHDGGSTFCS